MKSAAVIKNQLLLGAFSGLIACSAPGTPNFTSTGGPVPVGFQACKWVDPRKPTPEYISNFYLTTWGSALTEGASAGASTELGQADFLATPMQSLAPVPMDIGDAHLVPGGFEPPQFCMRLPSSDPSQALAAARYGLERHGYRSFAGTGGFHTSWHRGGHQSANWYDRFTVTGVSSGPNETVAKVAREVFIERLGPEFYVGEGHFFYEGVSVGNNEAWVLGQM